MLFSILVILLIIFIIIFRKLGFSFKAAEIPPEQEPSTPSSSSPTTSESSEFDVFLSFRGEDTRMGFTDHLFQGLQLRGVSTFRDSEGLKKGEEIKELLPYIEKSKICIPIISEGYGNSKWCLKELAKMMECNKKVIPVFFKVDPSHVKNQTGPFASAFKGHESNVKLKQEEVRNWKQALTKVGNLSGYTLKDTLGYEAKLVQSIVKRVLGEVNSCQLHEGEYIIGHESHLEKLMSLMNMELNDVLMIGIHGMGGIGKTTVATAVYNKIYSKFEAYSFISNVREASQHYTGIETLQEQLLRDVFHDDGQPITDKKKGTQLIKERISAKKVLIIIDDVDSKDQLDALVGTPKWFRKGSRIIITTRDKKPLIDHELKDDQIFELQGLNHRDSMKLFCYHAFRREKPPSEEYAELCDEAVSSIQGLPLALTVFGRQFNDLKTPKEWKKTLKPLKESQNKDIFERLKLSYDSLTDKQKQVFLDIACFFLGKRKKRSKNVWWLEDDWWEVDDVKQFWEECDFDPVPAIKVLQHKALIKIIKWQERCNDRELSRKVVTRFEMHDMIRDMGMKILEDQARERKHSRLWNYPKVLQTLGKQRVPTTIEGIMFQAQEGAPNFTAPTLQEMDDLRLFHVVGANFEGFPRFPEVVGANFEGFPRFPEVPSIPDISNGLKWLGLPNCQHGQTSTSVISIPGEVAVLDLCENDDVANVLLEKCRSRITVYNKLKILDLSFTSITITPDFSSAPHMVKLTLKYCRKLVEVHESVGQLKSALVWLNLTCCEQLKKLPHTICELTSLEFLSLYECSKLLDLPEQLGNMGSLKHLDLRTSSQRKISLPNSMRKLQVLERLLVSAINIREIVFSKDSEDLVAKRELISSFGDVLNALPDACCRTKTQLELIGDMVGELTGSLTRWENLESLILKCKSLKSLPNWTGQLQNLKVLKVYSDNIVIADDAFPLESIEELVLECVNLEQVSSFSRKAQHLKHLTLNCKNMKVLPDSIGSSSNLEKLMLIDCKELIEVHESIGSLKKLELLKITGCTMLERLPDNICEFDSLKSLDLKGCINLSSLPEKWICQQELLEELCLDETGIRNLPASMGKLTRLQSLSIKNCQSLNSISDSLLSCLESLKEVHIKDNPLKEMSNDNYFYFELTSTGSLRASTSWEFMDALSIPCCEPILDLCFTNEKIEKLTDSMGRFKNVESMTLRCKMLKAIPASTEQLKNLKNLTLQCHTLAFDIIYLLADSIEKLEVECIQLEPLPSSSAVLGTLTATGCENVEEKSVVTRHLGCFNLERHMSTVKKELRKLELCCKQMTVTPDFYFAPFLEELTLRDCEMLTEVHHSIGILHNLKVLKIKGCNALEGLTDAICHLTSLRSLELTQEFNPILSSSPEAWIDLEQLGVRGTVINRILSSTRQLTQLKELCLRKSCAGWTRFYGIVLKGSTLEISGSCSEWVTCLESCPLQSVTDIQIMDVQMEELPDCYIARKEKESSRSIVQVMKELRRFEFCCKQITVTPDFSFAPFLEELTLTDCEMLTEVHHSIGTLENLKSLYIKACNALEGLPDTICHLTSLESLVLRQEFNPTSSSSPEAWRDLEQLGLRGTAIKGILNSTRQLTQLKQLCLRKSCPGWTGFYGIELSRYGSCVLSASCSEWVTWVESCPLQSITDLEIMDDQIEELPDCSIARKEKESNRSIVQVMKELRRFEFCCKQITVTPDFSFAPFLEELTLRDCEMLTEVHHSIGTLENLKVLKIKGCNALEGLPDTICHLTSLESLVLRQEFNPTSSSSPEAWRDLEQLGLRGAAIKSILNSTRQLAQLKELCLRKSCPGWTGFYGIKLSQSSYDSSWGISVSCSEWVTWLESCPSQSVTELEIMDDQIEELLDCSVAQMEKLWCLTLRCKSLRALPNCIGQLKRLQTLQVYSDNLTLFEEMGTLENIQSITSLALECPNLESLPDWVLSLGGLRSLSLRGCQIIKHLPHSIGQLEGLIYLDLSGTGIVELRPWLGTNLLSVLSHQMTSVDLSGLQRLLVSGCKPLRPIRHLSTSRPEGVNVSGFKQFHSIPHPCSRLEGLDVSGCKQLHSIPPLSSSVLRSLNASGCTNLRGLPDLSNLRSLVELYLGGCCSLEDIPGFETIAKNIEWLELPGPSGGIQCSSLTDDFKNKVFPEARFWRLQEFKMGGILISGSHGGQQCLSFLFPYCRDKYCSLLQLSFAGISSPVKMAVVKVDDCVLFETTLMEVEFDNDDKGCSTITFSYEKGDKETLEHLREGPCTILVWTDVSELSKVELKAGFAQVEAVQS